MSRVTYDELQFPYYLNSAVAVRIPAQVAGEVKSIELTLSDVVLAAEIAGLNMLFIANTGRGKTQLISDIVLYHFGGYNNDVGNGNWGDGRANFEIEDLFVRSIADLTTGKYDSETARQLKKDRIRRMCFCVDELNRAPKLKQNEFFDLADGKYSFNGVRHKLGKEGYTLFLATANINKNNGEFTGISDGFDRALLNRAHLTIDLDHYKPTPQDKMVVRNRKKKSGPRVDADIDPIDLSDKILEAHREITALEDNDPYMLAFQFIMDDGLDYCEKDKYKEKGPAFPMQCLECTAPVNRDLCSLVKGSSERTVNAVAPLAYALSYIASLKEGKEVLIDPLDAALQAFKFTTYHGNLNENIANEQFAGRKQAMMDSVVDKLEAVVSIVKDYIPIMAEGHEPVLITYTNGREIRTAKTEAITKSLQKSGISYTEKNLVDELKQNGIGTGWVESYAKEIAKKE